MKEKEPPCRVVFALFVQYTCLLQKLSDSSEETNIPHYFSTTRFIRSEYFNIDPLEIFYFAIRICFALCFASTGHKTWSVDLQLSFSELNYMESTESTEFMEY